MPRSAHAITAGLLHLFPEGRVHRSDDATAARLEGFEAQHDPPGEELVVTEGDCRFAVIPGAGHKTGLYMDQSENRALLARHARGRRILDGFCYAGAFACHALARGAGQALLLDSSANAAITPSCSPFRSPATSPASSSSESPRLRGRKRAGARRASGTRPRCVPEYCSRRGGV